MCDVSFETPGDSARFFVNIVCSIRPLWDPFHRAPLRSSYRSRNIRKQGVDSDGQGSAKVVAADDNNNNEPCSLPHGQVLMRHEEGAGRAAASAVALAEMTTGRTSSNPRATHDIPGLLRAEGAAGGFLCFPEPALGEGGCCLEDGEELVLVSMEYHR